MQATAIRRVWIVQYTYNCTCAYSRLDFSVTLERPCTISSWSLLIYKGV